MSSEQQSAAIGTMTSISRMWILPLIALLVGGWMVYQQWSNQGTRITIELEQATGLEADKTKIKSRDVDIGVVKKIELKEDLSGVIITAQIEQSAEHLLRKDSHFWVVKPRVSISGISGLTTLLSGPYIALAPSGEGPLQRHFVALENPPVTPAGTPGLHVTLRSEDDFSFKEGDSVVHKGLRVGEFEDVYFNIEEDVVYYNVFIEDPFHKLITENTKFWNSSGLSVELAASGFSARTGSLETLLTNAVTFGIPEGMPRGKRISERSYFEILADEKTAVDQRYNARARFVLMISESVRGLTKGAPVEYRGIKIGEVLQVNMAGPQEANMLSQGYDIPVLIELQPGRLALTDDEAGVAALKQRIRSWIGEGLRASLKMGNLLTGGLYVDIQHYQEVSETTAGIDTYLRYDVIPTQSTQFTQMTQKVNAILDKVNAFPLRSLGHEANALLREASNAAKTIEHTSSSLNALLVNAKNEQLAVRLSQALSSFDKLVSDYAAGSQSHEAFVSGLSTLEATLNELKPLIQQLNSKPNSLLFSDGSNEVIIPTKKPPKND